MNNRSSFILFSLIIALFFTATNCNNISELGNPSGTVSQIKTWNLPVSDTSNILIKKGEYYTLNYPADSLINRTDTIKYEPADQIKYESIFGRIDQVVINSKNKNINELYQNNDGAVYLVGYSFKGESESYTKFTPPLLILPAVDAAFDTSTSVMQNWNKEKNSFETSTNTKSRIKLLGNGKIMTENNVEEFYEYEMVISRDEKINYGEQGLIVPDAVILKSILVYSKGLGLIAEWGIRVKENKMEPDTKKGMEPFLELVKYSNINNSGDVR